MGSIRGAEVLLRGFLWLLQWSSRAPLSWLWYLIIGLTLANQHKHTLKEVLPNAKINGVGHFLEVLFFISFFFFPTDKA